MRPVINIATIGAGIGGDYLDAYRQLTNWFRVRTVCDLDGEGAASIIGGDDIAVETNFNTVLADPAIDPDRQVHVDEALASVSSKRVGFAEFFEAIADCLTDTANDEVSLAYGRRSIKLVTAVYQAARSQGSVELPVGPDTLYYDGWLPFQENKGT